MKKKKKTFEERYVELLKDGWESSNAARTAWDETILACPRSKEERKWAEQLAEAGIDEETYNLWFGHDV